MTDFDSESEGSVLQTADEDLYDCFVESKSCMSALQNSAECCSLDIIHR